MEVEISVIVPHLDDLAGLDACLSALCVQTLPRDRFEIVVADNGSACGRMALEAAIAGRARLVEATQRGAGPARNAGVAAAQGEIFAFTDSDCLPEPGWLAAGAAALGGADVVGGKMTVSIVRGRPMSGAEAFESVFAFDNRSYVERKGFTVTANLFCRRPVFEDVGGFRVEVSEDIDWCRRAAARGYRVAYAEGAAVAHPARRDWAELKRKWVRMNRENYGLAVQRPLGRWGWLGRNLLMPFSIVAHLPRVLHSPKLPDRRARLAALSTLVRLRLWRMTDAFALALRPPR